MMTLRHYDSGSGDGESGMCQDGQRLVSLYPPELQMLMVWTESNLSRNQRLLWLPVSGGAGA